MEKRIRKRSEDVIYNYYQYARPNDKLHALYKTRLLAGQTRNARAANAFATLIRIGYRNVEKLRLANGNLSIPEDTISMPKLVRICTCSLSLSL